MVNESFENDIVTWNVFKKVNLNDLNIKFRDDAEIKAINAKQSRIEHTMTLTYKLPKSYTTLSIDEIKLNEYLELFEKYFILHYPYRRQLYLTPK